MKKKLLRGIIVAVMGVMLCACGSNGSNTTTEAEASPVVSDFVEFMNTELPPVVAKETEAMAAYNKYFTGETVDAAALLQEMNNTVIPDYNEFLSDLEAITVETDEVKKIYEAYSEAMKLQYDGLCKMEQALRNSDTDMQTEAVGLFNDARNKYSTYQILVKELADKYGIKLNGEFADVATNSVNSSDASTEASSDDATSEETTSEEITSEETTDTSSQE